MTCMTKESRLSLPGAYCHGNDMTATASPSLVDTYQQDDVIDPATHHNDNKLAIISPIFFSPSLSPGGSLRTSLPGTWVDTSPYQLQNDNKENDFTHITSNNTLQQYPYHHRHHHLHQQQQQEQQQEQQQKGSPTSIAPTPVTTVAAVAAAASPPSPSPSSAVLDHVDMNQLRLTIASLRERAEQLEQTDLVVKKSIEIVAKKRLVWERRQYAQWDWCDQPGSGSGSGGDEGGCGNNEQAQRTPTSGGGNNNVPILDTMDETDRSDDDDDDDNDVYEGCCGGDWEWID